MKKLLLIILLVSTAAYASSPQCPYDGSGASYSGTDSSSGYTMKKWTCFLNGHTFYTR